ncbi:MAG: trypsin-like serine protease [Marinobacter sp.]|uniref:trypsin-like serine protease n=1 Tax=Marinobacter TaxID=2742 RepID=UPI001BCA8439|nr:trypsin-like serine protease [Marinobacter lipolyticus]MBS8239747.1 hypothetical protein [Marinobacter lipolyticus]
MVQVVTLRDIARERMNTCSDQLARKFLRSVRPIFGSTKHGEPEHIGSCVLVEFGGTKYVVTAAHVIDNNEQTTLYVSGEKNLVEIVGDFLVTEPPSGHRGNDKLDFAVHKVSEDFEASLGHLDYIDEKECLTHSQREPQKFCLALGYPNSKNKKFDRNAKTVKEVPFIYSSFLKHEADLFSAVGASATSHLLLDFCGKYSKDEEGNKVNSWSPIGVSGGGLFSIKGLDFASIRADSWCQGKLIGIFIEFHRAQKVLVAVKLSTIYAALINAGKGRF